jgi:succinyl-CoA synthetase beta subunit
MARKRLSEYKAKLLLSSTLGQEYHGFSATANTIPSLSKQISSYVVKVDQGVKKRFKKGLVMLNVPADHVPQAVNTLAEKGYSQFIIEPQQRYDSSAEHYLSLMRERGGITLFYSDKGGIDIEENQSSVKKLFIRTFDKETIRLAAKEINLDELILQALIFACNTYFFSFLEINPFIVKNKAFIMLDAAVEVDSTAEFFVEGAWSETDFVEERNTAFTEVEQVRALASRSQAAFSLTVLNPEGSLGMLLSSGGASIVLADEAGNLGYGRELINYGEYSGNPNAEETYLYTKSILSLVLKSNARKKALIIAGAVANFTDIRVTFLGVIKALKEQAESLRKQHIKVFVRRGGPNQKEGLLLMTEFLEKEELYGQVKGPEMVLTDIVHEAISYIK